MKKEKERHKRGDTFRYLKDKQKIQKTRKLTMIDRRFNKRGNYYMKPLRLYHKQRSKEKWNEKNQTKLQKDSFRGIISHNQNIRTI